MNHTKFKELVSTMPPLKHDSGSVPFDINQSQAFNWIISQPGVKQWIWERFRGTGRIEYDAELKLWKGINRKSHADKTLVNQEDWS